MQKIIPFLWFDKEAEEAARFYVSVFKGVFKGAKTKLGAISRYSKEAALASGQPAGSAMVVEFQLCGQQFNALNGGRPPDFDVRFSGAISFVIGCKSQKEVDALWTKLTADGGEPGQCGWLQDKYGVSWQVVPDAMSKYIGGKSREGAERALAVMLGMTKLDIAALKQAYEGRLSK
jgi:predicted 3-demethylubiquinone-9 3-methyltransferase (glyoxalase superfamily)